ncbi:MAG: asparagine synthase (glutamine-hydrolyzing) [Candidatus Aminicenantaceae bacterium]
MCGICGFALPDSRSKTSADRLEAMCRTITHRGPDDQGLYAGQGAALGARRLSIIDLETGHQPISNEDGTLWIAYNGEVYNFPELKQELAGRGHRFKTRTDTETILHAYEEWGRDMVQKLRGMFAAAIWDDRTKSLYLFRDRLGIKPLYYTRLQDGALVFGSELKAVLAYPGMPRNIDPRALDFFLTLEYIPAPRSIFTDIHKLPAGCLLQYRQGRMDIRRYWDISPEQNNPAPLRPLDSLQDEFYALLKESVQMRLISDVPLGAFLSGGIDSSAVVGLMRASGASPLKTFSIGFEDKTYDELDHARRVARKFDTDHQEFIIRPDALELTEKLIRHLDEPLGDFSIFPTYLVSRMARKHVKVILSGDGGDEVCGGYEHYQAQKLAQSPWLSPVNALLPHIARRMPPSSRKKGVWNKLQRYGQGLELDPRLRHFRWMTFLSPQAKNRLYTPEFLESLNGGSLLHHTPPFSAFFQKAESFDSQNGELYLDLHTYLIDDILVKVDRMTMAASLETRVPLLDHKVVEFMFRLPGRYKLKGLTTKWFLKKTMERLLPRENIYRKKEGFSIPIKHWLQKELKELMLDRLDSARIKQDGYFRTGEVERLIRSHLDGTRNNSHQIWALLVFSLWKDHYLD